MAKTTGRTNAETGTGVGGQRGGKTPRTTAASRKRERQAQRDELNAEVEQTTRAPGPATWENVAAGALPLHDRRQGRGADQGARERAGEGVHEPGALGLCTPSTIDGQGAAVRATHRPLHAGAQRHAPGSRPAVRARSCTSRSGNLFATLPLNVYEHNQLREQRRSHSHSRSHNVRNARCSARNPADEATILPHLSLPPVVDRRQPPTFAAVDRLAGSRPFKNGCPSRRRDRCRTRRCPDRA